MLEDGLYFVLQVVSQALLLPSCTDVANILPAMLIGGGTVIRQPAPFDMVQIFLPLVQLSLGGLVWFGGSTGHATS